MTGRTWQLGPTTHDHLASIVSGPPIRQPVSVREIDALPDEVPAVALPNGWRVDRYDFDGGTARLDVMHRSTIHASVYVLPLTRRWRVRASFVACEPACATAIMHALGLACALAAEREAGG